MKNKKTSIQPIPKIISLFPEDENFEDTRSIIEGAIISKKAWKKINDAFHSSNDKEVLQTISEIKEGNSNILKCDDIDGLFIEDYQFEDLERKLSFPSTTLPMKVESKTSNEPPKQSRESTTLPTKIDNKKQKLTWEQRNQTPLTRWLSEKAKRKNESESKKN